MVLQVSVKYFINKQNVTGFMPFSRASKHAVGAEAEVTLAPDDHVIMHNDA